MAESYHIGAALSLHWCLIGRKIVLKILKLGKVFMDDPSPKCPAPPFLDVSGPRCPAPPFLDDSSPRHHASPWESPFPRENYLTEPSQSSKSQTQ